MKTIVSFLLMLVLAEGILLLRVRRENQSLLLASSQVEAFRSQLAHAAEVAAQHETNLQAVRDEVGRLQDKLGRSKAALKEMASHRPNEATAPEKEREVQPVGLTTNDVDLVGMRVTGTNTVGLENDYLRQENKILRRKLGSRVPLTEADRRVLVKYGLRIRARLGEVISIAKPCRYLVHDQDASFAALDGILKTDALHLLKTPPHSPLCSSYTERHVREIRETLDQLILLGEGHLRHALSNIEKHHNSCRPHQGIGNVIPLDFDYPVEPALPTDVQCQEALGGLLNHYSIQRAA